jgi:hypothetical protein
MRATYSASTLGMHHMSFCQGFQSGFEITFNEAALGPVNGRAADSHSSGNIFVAEPAVGREQNLGSFDLAGVMLAAAHQRDEFTPLGFAQFDMVAYVHPGLLANHEAQTNQAMNQLFGTCTRLPRSPTSEVSTWPSSTPPRAHRFHQEYGTILGVIGALPIPVRRVSPTRLKKTGKHHGSARSQSLEGCWLGRRGRPGNVEVRTLTANGSRACESHLSEDGAAGGARESTGLRISTPLPVVESIKLFR